jgi:sterol desaturase/sphingolipid hydroxylase (fatty acid hydroxylase superfamily)
VGDLFGTAAGAVVLAGLLSAAEWIDPEDQDLRRHRTRGSRVDVVWFVVYLAYAPLTGLAAMALVSNLAHHGITRSIVERQPWSVRVVGAMLVAELAAYWLHRAMHAVPRLWRVHSVHHGATDLHWWSTFRFHPIDGALAHAAPLLVAAACGFGPDVLAVYLGVVFVVTAFAHADVWVPATILDRLVVVPRFHRTHHETGCDDTNFALVLPVYDALFGTATHSTGARRFGIDRKADQRMTAKPIASDVRLATQLSASAPRGSAWRRRQTRTASR